MPDSELAPSQVVESGYVSDLRSRLLQISVVRSSHYDCVNLA